MESNEPIERGGQAGVPGTHTDLAGQIVAETYALQRLLASLPDDASLWRGEDIVSGDAVVCQVLPDFGPRFDAAVSYLTALGSLHIAPISAYGRTPWPHIVYATDGMRSIREQIAAQTVAPPDALHIADQLLDVLEKSHPRGIVHGTLSLDTVYVSHDGLARPSAMLLGLGLGPVDHTATMDVQAVGALLYTMVAGEPPVVLPDGTVASLSVTASGLTVPPAFEQVVMLAVGPETDRFASVEEMREALRFADRQLRRPRTGRSARLVVTTAPGMRRAMGNVAEFQTSEIAAIPMRFPTVSKHPQMGTVDRATTPAKPSALANSRTISFDVAAPLEPKAPAKRPARPITPPPNPVPAPTAARADRFSWLIVVLFALLAGGIIAALIISSGDGETVSMESGTPGPVAPSSVETTVSR